MSLPFDPDDPFRLTVLKQLSVCIGRVTPANGFKHNLSESVFRGRSIYGDGDPLPMVSILGPPIPLETLHGRGDNPNSTGDWELLIQGFVDDDRENPSDPAHRLMAEVKKVIIDEKKRNGGFDILGLGPKSEGNPNTGNRVIDLHIGQGSVRPSDEVSARAYFWLMLTVKLAENQSDPYG